MIPNDDRSMEATKAFAFGRLRHLYLRMEPLDRLAAEARALGLLDNIELQDEFVRRVVEASVSQKFPPSKGFTCRALKTLMQDAELSLVEVGEKLVEAFYFRVASYKRPEDDDKPCCRSYPFPDPGIFASECENKHAPLSDPLPYVPGALDCPTTSMQPSCPVHGYDKNECELLQHMEEEGNVECCGWDTVLSLGVRERCNEVGLTTWDAGLYLVEYLETYAVRPLWRALGKGLQRAEIPSGPQQRKPGEGWTRQGRRGLLDGLRVLELGSGVGMASIVASRWCGCEAFGATDFSSRVMMNLRSNMKSNGVQLSRDWRVVTGIASDSQDESSWDDDENVEYHQDWDSSGCNTPPSSDNDIGEDDDNPKKVRRTEGLREGEKRAQEAGGQSTPSPSVSCVESQKLDSSSSSSSSSLSKVKEDATSSVVSSVEFLNWQRSTDSDLVAFREAHGFDLLLASDCVYDNDLTADFVRVLRAFILGVEEREKLQGVRRVQRASCRFVDIAKEAEKTREVLALVACAVRAEKTFNFFVDKCRESDLIVEEVEEEVVHLFDYTKEYVKLLAVYSAIRDSSD